jgi:hypothetical protein
MSILLAVLSGGSDAAELLASFSKRNVRICRAVLIDACGCETELQDID